MRIGLETLSCDSTTGIGRIVRALAVAFIERGHEVHILTHDPGVLDEQIRVHKVTGFSRSKGLSKILFRVFEEQRLRKLNCDVVYSFGVGRCADVVAAQSCHRAGMEVLDAYSLSSWEERNLGLYDMISLGDEKALVDPSKKRRIIACSNLVKSQLVGNYSVDPDRIVVIPNGISPGETDRSAPTQALLRMEWGIGKEEKVLLFMGNEFARKGLHIVLEAMGRVARSDLRLIVAGGGKVSPYRRLVSALRLSERVTFLGAVENPERLFSVADLFVFPTLYEPFGMAVLESMAAGVPVITSKTCGAVEGMEHGRHGIFLDDPASAGDLATWINALLADRDLYRTLSTEGRSKGGEFCWDLIADRTLDVLDGARMERRNP
jgi:UDP-glucose:(heptosyl)LPS alpha-1,3-glucosyltransferase